jgi:excisionase family DNA binding protein
MSELRHRHVLTTGQVAELCGVGNRTIAKWCDAGLLPSYRIPTLQNQDKGGHRRVYADELAKFLKARSIRLPPGLAERVQPAVLLCGLLPFEAARLSAGLTKAGWTCAAAESWPEAMLKVHHRPPSLFVATAMMGRSDCLGWASTVRVSSAESCRLVYVPGDDETEPHLFEARGWEVIRSPLTIEKLSPAEE